MKRDFFIFYRVNLTGSGLLNRAGAEIGYIIKNAKKLGAEIG